MALDFADQNTTPYIYGPPVSGKHFVGREDIIQTMITKTLPPNPIPLLIRGEPRIGKTSLLQEFERQINEFTETNSRAILISFEFMPDLNLEDFVYYLSSFLVNSLDENNLEDIPDKLFLDSEYNIQKKFFESFLPQVFEVSQCSHIILIFEEEVADSLKNASSEIVEFIKHLFNKENKLVPIFNLSSINFEASESPLRKILTQSELILIKTLSFKNTEDLITSLAPSYLVYEENCVKEIWKLTHGHPCLTQLVCSCMHETIKTDQVESNSIEKSMIENILPDVFTSGEFIFDSIWRSFNKTQQLILAGLAKLNVSLPTHIDASETDIQELIRDSDLDRKHLNYPKEFMRLTQSHVLRQKTNNNTRFYRFEIDLLRMWIQEKKPFDELVYELINSDYLIRIQECEGLWTIRKQLIQLRRIAEEKAAQFGINTPHETIIQLEHVEKEIKKNEQKLKALNCEEMKGYTKNGHKFSF